MVVLSLVGQTTKELPLEAEMEPVVQEVVVEAVVRE